MTTYIMQNSKWKRIGGTLGIAVIVLAGSLAPSKAQAQENFAWITNTNGVTWKKEISDEGVLSFWQDYFEAKPKIAEIVVPEHAQLIYIDVSDCVNLTNIVLQPATVKEIEHFDARGFLIDLGDPHLDINAYNSGLRSITRRKTMGVDVYFGSVRPAGVPGYIKIRRTIQWTVLEKLPKMEIRTHSTDNGPEVEIVWREGNLQIADAVNEEYRDHLGQSPLRFPLAAAKDKQFFRIAKIESPTTEEPPTPQTLGGNR